MWVRDNRNHTKWNTEKQSHRHVCKKDNTIYHHKEHLTYTYVGVPEEEHGKMGKKKYSRI